MRLLDAELIRSDAAFASVREVATCFAGDEQVPTVAQIQTRVAGRLQRAGISLEAQRKKKIKGPRSLDDLYVGRIVRLRRLPTRERNLHDLCNVWIWATFPLAKHALSERQLLLHVETHGEGSFTQLPNRRSREEDALAMVDEGGLLVCAQPQLVEHLEQAARAGQSGPLLSAIKEGDASASVFGHALLEHRLQRLDARATVVFLPLPPHAGQGEIDSELAAALADRQRFCQPEGLGPSLSVLFGLTALSVRKAPLEAQ